jgi:Macrocin-O-methyltransferase (TylF)
MADPTDDTALLRGILQELRRHREIPSTALRLRELSVEDSCEYIRSEPRFRAAQVMLHNHLSMQAALLGAPAWDGMVLEFGVHRGASLRRIAKFFPDQVVHGFDSFVGLPEAWSGNPQPAGAFDVGGKPPELDASNVAFHIGWFEETVPPFAAQATENIKFAHLDADLYSSTATVFNLLRDRFVPGTVIVFDEYFGYHGWQDHEHKAFQEFLEETGYTFEALSIGHMNLAVRLLEA